jgi:hypothetical protein
MLKKSLLTVLGVFSIIMLASYGSIINTQHQQERNHLSQQIIDSIQFNDGPYVFISNDSLIEKMIVNGKIESRFMGFYSESKPFSNELTAYKTNGKIAALSDIHGQLDLAVKIFKNNGIIDQNSNWSFGNGQLVIVGDLFDRGDKVTDLLWFVYHLEKQAAKHGGKVHVLLGNHEYMVMQNDLRYVNKKYRLTSRILRKSYDNLFDNSTLLGKWLRSKATVIKINDNVFVHGGISEEFIKNNPDLDKTNRQMRQSLLGDNSSSHKDSIYEKYFDSKGPIWYRGYFLDSLKNSNIKSVLRALKAKHVIVGHTSQTKIESLFKRKILAVDSSIKNGVYGELLLIENGEYYRGTMSGEKIKLE